MDSLIGIEAWNAQAPPNRPDLFEHDDTGRFAFPCSMCKHNGRDAVLCAPCRHFA
jgi:hypothetical protein